MNDSIREKLATLLENKNALAAAMSSAGADSPPTDGLADLVEDMRGVVVPKGVTTTAQVSASGRVMRSEFVQWVHEYSTAGDELRFALNDVHILAAEPLREGRVGVVFTQGESTKFKVIGHQNGELLLGNTLEITDEAMTEAALVSISPTKCAVLYAPDAGTEYLYDNDNSGYITYIDLDGRLATEDFTGTWDTESPYNITACAVNETEILVAYCRKTSGEAWIKLMRPWSRTWNNEVHWDVTTYGATRVDLPNETDQYANAWSLALVTGETAVLSCFADYDQPVAFGVVDLLRDQSSSTNAACAVRCIGGGKYASSMPNTQVVGLGAGVFALVYGVSWLSEQKTVLKSTVALELWGLTRYAAELLWYGCEDTRYQASIGGISALKSPTGMAVSYVAEGVAVSAAEGMTPSEVIPGPALPVCSADQFCRLIPIGQTRAMAVVQREGDAYVRMMDLSARVVPSSARTDGVALTGGEPGEEITVIETR